MIDMTWHRRMLARRKERTAWLWFRPRIARVLDEMNELHFEIYGLQALLDLSETQLKARQNTLDDLQRAVRESQQHLTLADDAVCAASAAVTGDGAGDPEGDAARAALDIARAALHGARTALREPCTFDPETDGGVEGLEP